MRYFSKVLTALFVLGAMTQAHAAGEFQQLRHRLLAGLPTTSVADFGQCKLQAKEKADAAGPVGGLLIRDFMIMPEPNLNIGYSDDHLTLLPDGTPVREIVQYRVLPNETATITVNRLAPTTYTALSKPMVFDCPLGTGLRFKPKSGIQPATIKSE